MKSKITTITQQEEEKSYQTVSEYLDYLDTIVDIDYDDQDYQTLDSVQRDLDDTFTENQIEDRSQEIKQHSQKVTGLQKDDNNLSVENSKDKKEINDKLSKAYESGREISNIEKDTQTKMQYFTSRFNHYFSIAKSYAMFDAPPEIISMLLKVGGTLGIAAGIYFAKKDFFNTLISQFSIKEVPKPVVTVVKEVAEKQKIFPDLTVLAREIARALGKFFSSF